MNVLTLGGGGMAIPFSGTKVQQSECDVRHFREVERALWVYEPDAVILTAGVSLPGPIEDSLYEEELATNLFGVFNVAQACTRYGIDRMVFIASVAGLYGKPNHAAYSASKAGVISLVQSLAMEGHTAYAIAPGRVNTPMREKDYPWDTPGSRLEPQRVWEVVQRCLDGVYASGDCILIRKVGLTDIVEEVVPTPWRDILKVGEPVTI